MQTRVTRSQAAALGSVAGAGFGTQPRALRATDFGRTLPAADEMWPGQDGLRQRVLVECLSAFEQASEDARFHRCAQANMARWAADAAGATPQSGRCKVRVMPGDWGDVTLQMTREYGKTFACLNMANAFCPGGGYVEGMVAQEENMFRRTDCHFALDRSDLVDSPYDGYLYEESHTALLSAAEGEVYLDAERPRVCIRGSEDRSRKDLGYPWLPDDEVYSFVGLKHLLC